jgi:hypothetical protein
MFNQMFGFGRKAKVDPSPVEVDIPVIEGTNARATARRLVRAQRAAPIYRHPDPVLTEDEEDQIRRAVSKRDHIPVDDVDLDTVETVSGPHRRAIRRSIERGEAKRRRKGQRAYNRMVRANPEPQPSNHEKIVARRQQVEVARLIEAGVDPQDAYSQVVGA